MLWQQDTHTGLETLPSVPQEQRSHLSIPLGHLPTSPQLCHNVSMHISLPLSLSIFLITCHRLSLSPPSLLFISLSLSHSLFLSLIASISVSLLLCLSLPHHLLLSFTPCHHLSSCPLSLPFYYLFLSLTGCWGWTGALRFH